MAITPFLAAINQLCDEKGIQKSEIFDIVKAALRAAYRKDYGNREQNVDVELDEQTGIARVFQIQTVVKKIENPNLEILQKDALKIDSNAKVGDELRADVTPPEYGRIAAQSAKQVIIQRLQEHERELMYDMFKDRENELINALVHRVENTSVYVTLDGRITTMLPFDEQIPGERYYGGQRLKLYLDKVIKTTKGPQLLISRRHPQLVAKLMELEIPEVKSGLVQIKGIARDPGVRCKVSVASTDAKIDPVGSCVGQKGVRVKNVIDELNGERIDIIQWSDNLQEYLKTVLAPAKISFVQLEEKSHHAKIYVQPDQRPLAIGKHGQNVQLASKLTGWEIDIMDVADLSPELVEKAALSGTPVPGMSAPQTKKEEGPTMVSDLGLPEEVLAKLVAANLTQTEQLKGLSEKDLMGVEGVDAESAKIIAAAIKNV